MSRIIKSAHAAGVSLLPSLTAAFVAEPPPAVGRRDEERQALLQRIGQLEGELRQRETETADLKAEIERAREDGREQGYESGLIAAEDRQSERLALLEEAMMGAHASLGESMQSLSRLAPLLAQECVDIIMGEASDRAEVIARIAKNQMAQLDQAMLVNVRVSRLDFPDDDALASLSGRLGLAGIAVSADGDIPSGGCTMVLRLGRMDVGFDQQWPALRSLLGEMSSSEALL